MDEQANPKFTFSPVAKRVFVRNYSYENICHLYIHSPKNQVFFMWNI